MLFDLVILGSGPAGLRSAIIAAREGKKVAVVEDQELGGAAVHQGTLPSKSFRESVYRWSLRSESKNERPNMKRLLQRRDSVVTNESQIIEETLKANKVAVYHGKARLTSANDVEVTSKKGQEKYTEKLTAEFIFLAVGAKPVAPAHLPVDKKLVFDSNSILELKELPDTMVVLGGGIIGCEFASIFSTAKTKVFLVDRRHEILASVDREIVDHLTERFTEQKLELVLEASATSIEKKEGGGVRVILDNGRKLSADCVLVAMGRYGNTDGIGLEEVGVERDERGLIHVDQYHRTTVPNIYAIGDVVGAPALASTSAEQGSVATYHALKLGERRMPEHFPYGIYTIPEISMVGLTEEHLQDAKMEYVVGHARYREIARGQIVGDRWGLLKLIVDPKTLKLHGVHVMGDAAANLVHIGQTVMDLGGDINYFIRTVFNYPTLAEAYKVAAFDALRQLKGSRV